VCAGLEGCSDVVLTGHEHGHDHYAKQRPAGLNSVTYLEGGVLQERGDKSISTFSVLSLDFVANQARFVRLELAEAGLYRTLPHAETQPLPRNPSKQKGTVLVPESTFRSFLDESESPTGISDGAAVRLREIFTYPDVRERPKSAGDKTWIRIRSEFVSSEVLTGPYCVISADAKGGKTWLAKQLCGDALLQNKTAVYFDCNELPNISSDDDARTLFRRVVEREYGAGAFERFEQDETVASFLALDNFHAVSAMRNQRAILLRVAESIFRCISLFVNIEFFLEEIHGAGNLTTCLGKYRQLQLCEFGFLKVEDLARRWLIARKQVADDNTVRRICDVIERVLRINAMPHHPWIVLVLLQEASSGHEIAAKNGSYGHLYQVLITTALAHSTVKIDIQSKYTYLSELALRMYCANKATLDLTDVKSFHVEHSRKYGVDFQYRDTIEDFVRLGLLRQTKSSISFRDKYAYWFFVAWHLGRHIHLPETLSIVQDLCRELHHEDSANIFIFLAHFTDNPVVIETILSSSRSLFAENVPAVLDVRSDLQSLNLLSAQEMQLSLPSTDPNENLRRQREAKDDVLANREPGHADGRKVLPKAPETPGDELSQFVRRLHAALKVIDILGQVLRNGVGAISADRKKILVEEVYLLIRRLQGKVLSDLPNDLPRWALALNEYFHEHNAEDSIAERVARISDHMVSVLTNIVYGLSRRVSHALAHEHLEPIFDAVLLNERSNATRILDLSTRLDLGNGVPVNKAGDLFDDLVGNTICRNAVKALVGNYLYLHRVDHADRQQMCARIGIAYDNSEFFDPSQKKHKKRIVSQLDSRKKKDRQRKRRGK